MRHALENAHLYGMNCESWWDSAKDRGVKKTEGIKSGKSAYKSRSADAGGSGTEKTGFGKLQSRKPKIAPSTPLTWSDAVEPVDEKYEQKSIADLVGATSATDMGSTKGSFHRSKASLSSGQVHR